MLAHIADHAVKGMSWDSFLVNMDAPHSVSIKKDFPMITWTGTQFTCTTDSSGIGCNWVALNAALATLSLWICPLSRWYIREHIEQSIEIISSCLIPILDLFVFPIPLQLYSTSCVIMQSIPDGVPNLCAASLVDHLVCSPGPFPAGGGMPSSTVSLLREIGQLLPDRHNLRSYPTNGHAGFDQPGSQKICIVHPFLDHSGTVLELACVSLSPKPIDKCKMFPKASTLGLGKPLRTLTAVPGRSKANLCTIFDVPIRHSHYLAPIIGPLRDIVLASLTNHVYSSPYPIMSIDNTMDPVHIVTWYPDLTTRAHSVPAAYFPKPTSVAAGHHP
jgi:hypothetical protein